MKTNELKALVLSALFILIVVLIVFVAINIFLMILPFIIIAALIIYFWHFVKRKSQPKQYVDVKYNVRHKK